MSRTKEGRHPSGLSPREPLNVSAALAEVGNEQLVEAFQGAQRLAYQLFGAEVDPFVGAQSQAHRWPDWWRVFVRIDGLPPLNYSLNDQSKPAFAVCCDCPICGTNLSVTFRTLLLLAEIREAPVRRCPTCQEFGTRTLVNLWTGNLYERD